MPLFGNPPPPPIPPGGYTNAFRPAYAVRCQWCSDAMHPGRNGIRFCLRCDHLQDMVGILPGREYRQPKGNE